MVPSLWERFLPPAFEAGNYGERSEAPNPGTVLEPQPAPYAVGGEWRGRRKREMWRAFGAALRGMGRGLRGG
jgi:hypothetical protein